MTSSFRRAHFYKHKHIQNDNRKIQQTNKQTNKQTSKLTHTNVGVIRGVIMPPRSNQPIETPCSSTFCYSVWCNTTANHQLKLPQQEFGNLYSIPIWRCSFAVVGMPSSGRKPLMQYAITGVICRIITPKGKERYLSHLTKQNAQGLRLCAGSSHLKKRKEIQAPL